MRNPVEWQAELVRIVGCRQADVVGFSIYGWPDARLFWEAGGHVWRQDFADLAPAGAPVDLGSARDYFPSSWPRHPDHARDSRR